MDGDVNEGEEEENEGEEQKEGEKGEEMEQTKPSVFQVFLLCSPKHCHHQPQAFLSTFYTFGNPTDRLNQ